MTDSGSSIGNTLAQLSRYLQKHALLVVLLTGLLAVGSSIYGVTHIGINTSTTEMFSSDLSWRRDLAKFEDAFPSLVDNILIVIDAQTPELADAAQRDLANVLRERSDLFNLVAAPESDEFFAKNGLLYLSERDIGDLTDRLRAVRPVLSKLAEEPHMAGLSNLILSAVTTVDGPEIGLDLLLPQLADAFNAAVYEQRYVISWRSVFAADNENSAAGLRRVILVSPNLDYSLTQPSEAAFEFIRQDVQALGLNSENGYRVRLTGSLAMQYEELESVASGMSTGALITFGLVIVVLILALRSWVLVVASLFTLLCGLSFTVAFAAAAVGHLNLISVAFAVLYIGLGIDFSIHFCLRYRELLDLGHDHSKAIPLVAMDVGASLVLCAITTSIGFYAFVPTDFLGMSELGLISGTGMFFSLISTLILLPALIHLLGSSREKSPLPTNRLLGSIGSASLQHSGTVRIVAVVVAVGAGWLALDAQFDSNPLTLRDPESESVSTYVDLMKDGDTAPLTLSLVVDEVAVDELRNELLAVETVKTVRGIRDFIPERQLGKLDSIQALGLLSDSLRTIVLAPALLERDMSRIEALNTAMKRLRRVPAALTLSRAMEHWVVRTRSLTTEQQRIALQDLSNSILGNLPSALGRIAAGLDAELVTRQHLPSILRQLWVTDGGELRLEIVPEEDISTNTGLRRFVQTVGLVVPGATGLPAAQYNAGNTLVRTLRQAFGTALLGIFVLLLVLTKSIRSTLAVIMPLLLAALLTGAATVVFAVPFNFANVITLPLLLGVGVDNGIHIVQRHRLARPKDGNLLATATARAIFYSTLTTVCSFGTLAFSSHPGTASMGILLTIGMALALVSSLMVIPTLLSSNKNLAEA